MSGCFVSGSVFFFSFFFFNDTATTEIYTLSLHDALPISRRARAERRRAARPRHALRVAEDRSPDRQHPARLAAPAACADGRQLAARCLQRASPRAARSAAPAERAERPAHPHRRARRRHARRRRGVLRLRAPRPQPQERTRRRADAQAPRPGDHRQARSAACRSRAGAHRRRARRRARARLAGRRGVPRAAQRAPLLRRQRTAEGHPHHERRGGRGQDAHLPEPRRRARRDGGPRAPDRCGSPAPGLPRPAWRGQRPRAFDLPHRGRGARRPRARPRHAVGRLHSRGACPPQPGTAARLATTPRRTRGDRGGLRLRAPRFAPGAAGDRRARARPRGGRGRPRAAGTRHAAGARPVRPRPPPPGRRAAARRRRQRRRPGMGRPLPLPALRRPLLPHLWPQRSRGCGRARMRGRGVLLGVQGLLAGLPLLRGGHPPWALALAMPAVLVLLALTLRARQEHGGPRAPAVGTLAAFLALGLASTVPLPPSWVRALSPHAAALYARLLPASGTWHALALDPWDAWLELARCAVAFGAFAVIVGYPWGDAAACRRVLRGLLGALLAGGTLGAFSGLVQVARGDGGPAGLLPAPRGGRASGPLVNPNHFAAVLELVIPLALASTAIVVLGLAHRASGSRGGLAAVLIGLGVAAGAAAADAIRRRRGPWRWLLLAPAAAGIVAGGCAFARWAAVPPAAYAGENPDSIEPSLGSRLAVAAQGLAVVAEYPVFGAGLGSWHVAYLPHQAPPVDGGIWDHAHDDYVELAAETGAVGLALAIACALIVLRAARRRGPGADVGLLRAGLAGGASAVLVHATVDFPLHVPASLLGLMTTLGLLVLTAAPRPNGRSWAIAALLALATAAAVPLAANTALLAAGAAPLSPCACLAQADVLLAEHGAAARAEALGLVRRAIALSPADPAAHAAFADVLGPGPAGDAALRRALALAPAATEVRDRLALRLWAEGDRSAAAAELEESVRRFPYLISHAALAPNPEATQPLGGRDPFSTRLAALPPELARAVELGLEQALAQVAAGAARVGIVSDLATLREARGRWQEAAALLRREAQRSHDAGTYLVRAARDYLAAREDGRAEEALRAGIAQMPQDGDLYRRLAIDIYLPRGDLAAAEETLRAGERAAADLLPVYRGTTELLSRREGAARGATP